MKTLVTLILACCFGSAMAQTNLPECQGRQLYWTDCFGRQTFSNGDQYVGNYRNGKFHGLGSYVYGGNGGTYAGNWEDGLRKGVGVYNFPNRDLYVGEFDVKANGQGIYTYANGDKYVGEFRDDQHHGQGVTITANGKVVASGIWENSQLIESKYIDLALFEKIPSISKFIPNISRRSKTEDKANQVEVEPETQLTANQKPSQPQKKYRPKASELP